MIDGAMGAEGILGFRLAEIAGRSLDFHGVYARAGRDRFKNNVVGVLCQFK